MKRLWTLLNTPFPNIYKTAGMAIVYVLMANALGQLGSLITVWAKTDNVFVFVHLGVLLGVMLGFVIYHFAIARNLRKIVDGQQNLLDKSLGIFREVIMRDGPAGEGDKPRRIEGDEWKDG